MGALPEPGGTADCSKDSDSYPAKHYGRYSFLHQIEREEGAISKFPVLQKEGRESVFSEAGISRALDSANPTLAGQKAEPDPKSDNGAAENGAYVNITRKDIRPPWGIRDPSLDEYRADVSLGYRLLPYCEVLLGRGVIVERKDDTVFDAHDDGWRMQFKLNF